MNLDKNNIKNKHKHKHTNIFLKYIQLSFDAFSFFVFTSIILICVYVTGSISYQFLRSIIDCSRGCSTIRMMNSPWMYHGREVTVVGFLVLRFEENAIYASEELADYTFDGFWLDGIPNEVMKERDKYNYRYVKITGRFNSWFHGHGSLFPGAIENIQKIEVLEPKQRFP